MSDAPTPKPEKHPSPWRVWGFRVARFTLIPYLVLCLFLMWFEERLLFPIHTAVEGNWQPEGLEVEHAWISTSDEVRLHGWFVAHPAPKAVVLMAHGNGGNVTLRAEKLRRLHAAGAATLIFDYRGYGKSEGSPNEQGILLDARAARIWLAKRAGVSETDIVLLGESLGGGVMVDLAARDGARGLILESTFTSTPDVAAHFYPFVPVHWLMRNRFDSLSKIGDYRGPLLASHGDQDEIIPYALGQKLFEAANTPKSFFPVKGGSHNSRDSVEYETVLAQWIAELK